MEHCEIHDTIRDYDRGTTSCAVLGQSDFAMINTMRHQPSEVVHTHGNDHFDAFLGAQLSIIGVQGVQAQRAEFNEAYYAYQRAIDYEYAHPAEIRARRLAYMALQTGAKA